MNDDFSLTDDQLEQFLAMSPACRIVGNRLSKMRKEKRLEELEVAAIYWETVYKDLRVEYFQRTANARDWVTRKRNCVDMLIAIAKAYGEITGGDGLEIPEIADEEDVLQSVKKIGDPLLKHIAEDLGVSRETVAPVAKVLVDRGLLRMKEDDVDHDWAYLLTDDGRKALALCR